MMKVTLLLLLVLTRPVLAEPVRTPGMAPAFFPRATAATHTTVGIDVMGFPATEVDPCFVAPCESTTTLHGGPALTVERPLPGRLSIDGRAGWFAGVNEPSGVFSAFVRWTALDREAVTLAPWVGGLAIVPLAGERPIVTISALGASLDVGAAKVRADLDLPLLTVSAAEGADLTQVDPVLGRAVVFGEAGVRLEVAEGQWVRLGVLALSPGVGWRGVFDATGVDAGVYAFNATGEVPPFGHVRVTRSF